MSGTDWGQAIRSDRDPSLWPELMRGAQAGDRRAYRRLLLAITPYLRAVAARLLHNAADAEDAVQDILMTLHAVRHTYDPDRPFKPWLAGIARHRLLDRRRGRARIAAREIALTLEHETFADAAANHEEPDWDVPALHAAVQALPAGQRQAVELLKLREMSLKEASSVSGLSIAALKVATHRAVKTLRGLLRDDGIR